MKSLAATHLRYLYALICTILFIFLTSCGTRTTPPGADMIGTSTPGMHISFLRWKEGLMLLFIDDVEGFHLSSGSGSTAGSIHTSTVSAGSPDSGGYHCKITTKDGISANCLINGKAHDLSKGAVFVIKEKGEQVEIHQLKRDLEKIPFDAHDCIDPIQKDAEIRKLLGLVELPE